MFISELCAILANEHFWGHSKASNPMIILHTSENEIKNNFEKFNDNDKMIDVRSVIFIQKFSKNLVYIPMKI